MVSFTITMSDAKAITLRDSLCVLGGYKDEIPNPEVTGQTIPNPVPKQTFAKQMIKKMLKDACYNGQYQTIVGMDDLDTMTVE